MVKATAAATEHVDDDRDERNEHDERDEQLAAAAGPQLGVFDEEQQEAEAGDEIEVDPADGECGTGEPPVIDESADDPAAEDATDIHEESPSDGGGSEPAGDGQDGSAGYNSPEARYDRELRALRDEYAASGLRIYHAKEELKLLKECHKELEERLDELEKRGPRHDYSGDAEHIRKSNGDGHGNGGQNENQSGDDPAAGGSMAASTAAGSTVNADAWRSVPVEDLGLPNTLAKIIREDNGIGTLGELSDFADRNGGDFSKLKKVGAKKAEKLRDECLPKFWREHPELIPGGDGAGMAGSAEAAADDDPAAEDANDSPAAGSAEGEEAGEANADGYSADELQSRAEELQSRNAFGGPQLTDSRYWDSGNEGYGRGLELSECPYATAEERDDWLRGWLWAESLAEK